jgi:Arc/MetJ family transcription regulator
LKLLGTLINIDDNILKEAMAIVGAKTKKETIQLALEELIKAGRRQHLKAMSGSGCISMTRDELKKTRMKRTGLHEELVKER